MRSGLLSLILLSTVAQAQWEMQVSGTSAELRGIDSVGNGVAWASGTEGTVLRTHDGGQHWQPCKVPTGAEMLEFRGVQALDANTAVVMSSGKGDLSRLYKTTDGCQTWRLVYTNPDKDGFFDALKMAAQPLLGRDGRKVYQGRVLGDPVHGNFAEFGSTDNGEHWQKLGDSEYTTPAAVGGEAVFAASNSALLLFPNGGELFVTGGLLGGRTRMLAESVKHGSHGRWQYVGGAIPLPAGKESTGAFSIAIAPQPPQRGAVFNTVRYDPTTVLYVDKGVLVAVGGDYKKPEVASKVAAYSVDSGLSWTSATTQPHGYRSAVAYDAAMKTWITVGPNGTDVSTDDGRNWQAAKPGSGDEPDADKSWNALSLPFVVGPKGRIGMWRSEATGTN